MNPDKMEVKLVGKAKILKDIGLPTFHGAVNVLECFTSAKSSSLVFM